MRGAGGAKAALVTAALVGLGYQLPVVYRKTPVGGPGLSGFGSKGMSQGRPWRWTGASSQMLFPLAGQVLPEGAHLRLDLGLPAWAAAQPRRVTVALDGTPLGTIDVPVGFAAHEFALPGDKRSPGDWMLSLTTEGGDPDPRDPRGVALVQAELRPRASPILPPLRTLLLAVLGVVALRALLASRLTLRTSSTATLAASGLVALALGLARPQAVVWLPWISVALLLLSGGDRLRRSSSSQVAARVSAFAPAAALAALVIGGSGVWPFLALVVALGACAFSRIRPSHRDEAGPAMRPEWILVLALSALALGFRLSCLEEIPFGIFRDEARHGLLALRLLDDPSYRPLFLGQPINQPLPYFLAMAAAVKAFGANLFALRIVSAVAGGLVIPLLYGLVREVLGRREALVAALLLAASSWHVSISRFAVNYVEPSLFSLPAYWLLWRALPQARLLGLGLAALLVGLGQYSAHTAKALLVVTAGLVADELVRRLVSRDKAGLGKLGVALVAAAALGLVTLAPLLAFVHENPDDYLSRAQQVSVWNHAAAEGEPVAPMLLRNILSYAGAFHAFGDPNGRHHLPRAPFLDPVAGLGLLAGLGIALTRPFSRACRFLLLWLAAGLLPGVLTVDAPSALRTIESAPAVYAVVALGLVALWDARQGLASPRWRPVPALLLAFAVAWNGWVYFVRMARSPAVWMSSAAVGTQVGKRLQELRGRGRLPEQMLLAVPRSFWDDDPDNPDVLRFFWPRGLKIGVLDDPLPLARRADAILLPNEADLWQLAAAEDPANAPRFARALADQALWRSRLGVELADPVLGPPFPGTDRPSFWLYLPTAAP